MIAPDSRSVRFGSRLPIASGLLFLIAACSFVRAAEPVALAWDFEPGSEFFLQEVVTVDQSVEVKDRNANTTSEQSTVYRYQVLPPDPSDRNDAGTPVRVRVQIDSIRVGDDEQLIFRNLEGAEFTLLLTVSEETGAFELREFIGYDAAVDRVVKDENQASLFRQLLPEPILQETLTAPLRLLPGRTLSTGESWKRETTLDMATFGSVLTTRTFTLGEPVAADNGDQADRSPLRSFKMTGTGTYLPPDAARTNLPFQIIKGELSLETAKGTGRFDTAAGRLKSFDETLTIGGTLTMGVGAQTEKVTVRQTRRVRLSVSSERPTRSSRRGR